MTKDVEGVMIQRFAVGLLACLVIGGWGSSAAAGNDCGNPRARVRDYRDSGAPPTSWGCSGYKVKPIFGNDFNPTREQTRDHRGVPPIVGGAGPSNRPPKP
jgi:hypothetical protein